MWYNKYVGRVYANIKPLLLGKKKQRFFAILASPEGEAVGGPARRLMRGKLTGNFPLTGNRANLPLIRPRSEPRAPSPRGKAFLF